MTKVLYIIGKGRSGSTLLNSVLGQADGLVSVGELVHLWELGVLKRWRCGCGKRVVECPVWSRVLAMLADDGSLDPEELLRRQNEVLSWGNLPRLFRQRPGAPSGWPALDEYVAVSGRLYRAIASVTGARCIVESTKLPVAPTALGLVPGIESYFVHLVRDPRAVVYSWTRTKSWDLEGEEPMPRFGPAYTTASWWLRNLLSEVVTRRRGQARSLVVRYEDFVTNPRDVVASILRLVREPGDDLSFVRDTSVELEPTHSVAGNASRFQAGRMKLELDEAWADRQPRSHRLVATALAVPFLQRYGYPVRPGRSSRAF
jgi:hypothetical protein